MYVGYINDRKKLGFNCVKDIECPNKMFTKGKQVFTVVFAKETQIAIFIFLKCSYTDIESYQYYISNEVYPSRVIKSTSDNLRFFNSPSGSGISDFILKLKGGTDELSNEEQKKLIKSILAKLEETHINQISINKLLKKVLEKIDPIVSDQRTWKILSEFRKPIKSELPCFSEVQSTKILGKTQSSSSSSMFVEALSNSHMQKKVQLKMCQNRRVQLQMGQNNLEPSGLSRNHEELPENIRLVEKLTKSRRAEPLYPSEVLGDSYKYGGGQLEKKGPRHLPEFGISIEGKTTQEIGIKYKDFVEDILSKPDLVRRPEGTFNWQEPTINIGDPEILGIVSFSKNPLYDDYYFISCYPITREAFTEFKETGNIGMSPEERAEMKNELQRIEAQEERERAAARSFYSILPEDARIDNKQLREVEALQKQLREDPSISLTEKQKNLIQRAERHQQYKNQFYQNNPDIDREDL